MKKAKIILVCIAILTITGGTHAFRVSRGPCNVYTLLQGNKVASITIGGIVYTTTIPNCVHTALITTAIGPLVNVSSTTTDAQSTTIFRSAGHPDQVATFPYCTLWQTHTTECDQ